MAAAVEALAASRGLAAGGAAAGGAGGAAGDRAQSTLVSEWLRETAASSALVHRDLVITPGSGLETAICSVLELSSYPLRSSPDPDSDP